MDSPKNLISVFACEIASMKKKKNVETRKGKFPCVSKLMSSALNFFPLSSLSVYATYDTYAVLTGIRGQKVAPMVAPWPNVFASFGLF